MKKQFFYILSLLILSLSVSGQELDLAKLDAYLQKGMQDYEQPGMAVGIVKDGKLVFEKGYGKQDLTKVPLVNSATVFQLASLSKAFTAAAIGTLVDKGQLNWDDLVVDHLPEFKLYDSYVTGNFTIRDLLCHRNGYQTFDGDLLWYGTNYTRSEILKRFAKLPPKHGFRAKYGYSNIMFIAAAVLIEAKTGKTWEAYVKEALLKPLEMNSTSVTFNEFLASDNHATPHVKNKPEVPINYNNAAGAVGVNSNIFDLSNWVSMWLNEGKFNATQVLKPQTVRELMQAQTQQTVSSRNEAAGTHLKAAASGWMVSDYKGYKRVEHSGGLPGFILNIALIPEKKLGVIVLTNGETLIPFSTTNSILDGYLIDSPKDWMSEYLVYHNAGKLAETKIELPKKPMPMVFSADELVGSYSDEMYGAASVRIENGKAVLQLDATKELFTSTLEPLSKTTYRIRFKDNFLPDGKITFQLDNTGKASGFTIDLPNPDFNFFNLNFKRKA